GVAWNLFRDGDIRRDNFIPFTRAMKAELSQLERVAEAVASRRPAQRLRERGVVEREEPELSVQLQPISRPLAEGVSHCVPQFRNVVSVRRIEFGEGFLLRVVEV